MFDGKLINRMNSEIRLVEVFCNSPPGSYGHVICLPPHGRCTYPSSEFSDRNRHAGRPSTILVEVNGVEESLLTPEDFKRFAKLVFDVDGGGKLTITGVEATFSDHFQFWGWQCFGRNANPPVRVD